ncbi:COG1361 S-layer family protein [Haloplanus sp. GCM10025708]|uniref:COG1361 S-layer family protein n=1 Tax=Haloplanus sp. GCM10025708 TaxID=3252679 RepID=UPI0036D29CA7
MIGEPDLTVLTSTEEFEPGTKAQLRLSVLNRGRIDKGGPSQYENRVTTARGLTVTVNAGDAPIEVNTGSLGVGNVPTGTTAVDPVDITVSEDAEPGTYRVPVEFSYAYTRGVNYDVYGAEYNDFTRTETAYLTIRVRDQARFEVVDSATSAQVGDTGDLAVTVENVGTRTARDASATLTSRSDELTFGSASASSTAYVGGWKPGERRTANYTVALADDAAVRGYTLDLRVDYTDTDGISRSSRPLNIGVRPMGEQRFSLEGVSTSLRVGQDGTLRGTVVNDGPSTVYNPVVRFRSTNPNIDVDSSEYALSTLAPGERADFQYTVGVSSAASASVQQFNLTVKYRNQRGDVRYSDGLETKADIAPQRDRFVVEVADDTIEAGGETALRVRVTNNGDEPLTNVEAKAFVNDPLASDNDEGIIAALAPGESAEFTIALSAAGNALPKTYPVSFDFQYELPDGDSEVSQTYKVPISVTPSQGGGFPTGLVVGAIAVVGLIGAVGWRRRNGN